MAVDLVMYLLRYISLHVYTLENTLLIDICSQGPYSSEGDIVVLCGYLGQLARMRDAFANKVAVVIDERDQVELADQEAEREYAGVDTQPSSKYETVKVTNRVRQYCNHSDCILMAHFS